MSVDTRRRSETLSVIDDTQRSFYPKSKLSEKKGGEGNTQSTSLSVRILPLSSFWFQLLSIHMPGLCIYFIYTPSILRK